MNTPQNLVAGPTITQDVGVLHSHTSLTPFEISHIKRVKKSPASDDIHQLQKKYWPILTDLCFYERPIFSKNWIASEHKVNISSLFNPQTEITYSVCHSAPKYCETGMSSQIIKFAQAPNVLWVVIPPKISDMTKIVHDTIQLNVYVSNNILLYPCQIEIEPERTLTEKLKTLFTAQNLIKHVDTPITLADITSWCPSFMNYNIITDFDTFKSVAIHARKERIGLIGNTETTELADRCKSQQEEHQRKYKNNTLNFPELMNKQKLDKGNVGVIGDKNEKIIINFHKLLHDRLFDMYTHDMLTIGCIQDVVSLVYVMAGNPQIYVDTFPTHFINNDSFKKWSHFGKEQSSFSKSNGLSDPRPDKPSHYDDIYEFMSNPNKVIHDGLTKTYVAKTFENNCIPPVNILRKDTIELSNSVNDIIHCHDNSTIIVSGYMGTEQPYQFMGSCKLINWSMRMSIDIFEFNYDVVATSAWTGLCRD